MRPSSRVIRPFFSLFIRPAMLLMTWLPFMALLGAALQTGDAGLALAFGGVLPEGADAQTATNMAHQLVIHASALLAAALGLIVRGTVAEIEQSPRVALAPGFYAITRNGALLVMAVAPIAVWLWARAWAPAAALELALLWMPWWFAIGYWDRRWLRGPGAVRVAPFALLLVVVVRPREYVAGVEHLGVWPALISIAVATVVLATAWSARVRADWMEQTNSGTSPGWWIAWMLDRSDRDAVQIPSGERRSLRWWHVYLRAERTENQRAGIARAVHLSLLTVFVYATGTTPALAAFSIAQGERSVGRPLLHPISRRARADLQFVEHVVEVLLIGLVMFSVHWLCVWASLPRFSRASTGMAPYELQLAAAMVLSPIMLWARVRVPSMSGDPKDRAALNGPNVLNYFVSIMVFMIAMTATLLSIWYAFEKQVAPTMASLIGVGVLSHILCYLALRRYYAKADLAPMIA